MKPKEELKISLENLYQQWSEFKDFIFTRNPEICEDIKNRMEAIDRDHRVVKNRKMESAKDGFDILLQLQKLRSDIAELTTVYEQEYGE